MTESHNSVGARTYRASSGPVVMVLSILLALFLLGDTAVRGSVAQMLLVAPWVLLGLWVVYEVSFVSMVRVDEAGAVVQNMLSRTTFGWSRVREIDLRWQLEFTLENDSRVTAYGGATRSRSPRSRPNGDVEAKAPAGVRDLTRIRDLWQGADASADAPIRRGLETRALVALAVIVLWAVGAVVVVNLG